MAIIFSAVRRALRWLASMLASFFVGWIGGSLLLLALAALAAQLLAAFFLIRFR